MNDRLLLGLAGGFGLLALAALAAALLALREGRRLRARCIAFEASLAVLRIEMEQLASLSVHTGRRVQRVEHDYSDVVDRVDVVESRNAAGAPPASVDRAIELARHGADADKLTEQFGLSPGEADLVARLHGGKKTA